MSSIPLEDFEELWELVSTLNAKLTNVQAELTATREELATTRAELATAMDALGEKADSADLARVEGKVEAQAAAIAQAATPLYHGVDEPLNLGVVDESNKNVNEIQLPGPGALPDEASQVGVVFWTRSGADTPKGRARISAWTDPAAKHHQFLYRYPVQNAISFDSSVVWFPFDANTRVLFTQVDVVSSNSHRTRVFFIGWQ